MNLFSNQPIKIKLMLLFATTSLAALSTACFGFMIFETISWKMAMRKESLAIAETLAQNSTAAISFGDRATAHELLEGLFAEPRIVHACIYAKSGVEFAQYSTEASGALCPPAKSTSNTSFSWRYLDIFVPIVLDGERIGELYFKVSLNDLYAQLMRFAAIALGLLCVSLCVSFLLSARLHRVVSAPLLHLTEVAGKVSAAGDYSIRAVKYSNDELGVLIDQFNRMMAEINQRDTELQGHRGQLEIHVAERTRALEAEIVERKAIETHLIEARIVADASNKAKSEFLANMSHELRTPLTAIIGYSEMLEEDALAESRSNVAVDLNRIQTAGRHLLLLVNDVLDLAKIEAGRAELHMESIPILDFVKRVQEMGNSLARKNNNRFALHCDASIRQVYADSVKLFQIMVNLLGNACKFTENGSISVTVVPETVDDKDWILWRIQDTGIGMKETDMAKLFQPFSQIDTSATRKYGGTGLGLSICDRLTSMMGGSISVQSVFGQGTIFTVNLPAGEDWVKTSQ